MSNFKWGQDFHRSYEENKKKFLKEVRRVRKVDRERKRQ